MPKVPANRVVQRDNADFGSFGSFILQREIRADCKVRAALNCVLQVHTCLIEAKSPFFHEAQSVLNLLGNLKRKGTAMKTRILILRAILPLGAVSCLLLATGLGVRAQFDAGRGVNGQRLNPAPDVPGTNAPPFTTNAIPPWTNRPPWTNQLPPRAAVPLPPQPSPPPGTTPPVNPVPPPAPVDPINPSIPSPNDPIKPPAPVEPINPIVPPQPPPPPPINPPVNPPVHPPTNPPTTPEPPAPPR